MDISNWPDHKIMMLPDWCFGRRWWVGSYAGSTTGVVQYVCSEENLPDKFVVWGVLIAFQSPSCLQAMRVTIRLARNSADITENATTLERLCKGISSHKIMYEFFVPQNGLVWVNDIRTIHESKDRRIAFAANGDQAIAYEGTIGVLISGVPREVPDWVVSGLAGMR